MKLRDKLSVNVACGVLTSGGQVKVGRMSLRPLFKYGVLHLVKQREKSSNVSSTLDVCIQKTSLF